MCVSENAFSVTDVCLVAFDVLPCVCSCPARVRIKLLSKNHRHVTFRNAIRNAKVAVAS